MRLLSRVAVCTFVVILTISQVSLEIFASSHQLYWGIEEGEKIFYRYQGQYVEYMQINETTVRCSIKFDEKIYFEIEDISGFPYPLATSESPVSTPFWANGTGFDMNGNLFWSNIALLEPIALKLGNWTFYEEHVNFMLDLEFDEIYHNQIGWVNETPTSWNFTLQYYRYTGEIFELVSSCVRQYSKSDGVLDHVRFEVPASSFSEESYQELTVIREIPNIYFFSAVISGGIILIVAIVILWKRRE